MTINELNNKLNDVIDAIGYNWAKCEDTEMLPQIMQAALDGFRESIIEYLETKED